MEWSPEQDAALRAVAEWLKNGEQQVFRLFGYAGTGKTTLARHFAEGVEGAVHFAAFTGKAAFVLRSKGCPGASTIHSLIYHSKDKGRARLRELEAELGEYCMELSCEPDVSTMEPDKREHYINTRPKVIELRKEIEEERRTLARPMFTLNHDSVVKDAELVVIDECSMVDGQMGQDLLYYGTKVLVLGDPAQLPPVYGAGFFTEGVQPDVMLTEIHRQAAENPIIAMATKVRNGERLDLGDYGASRVVPQAGAATVMAADQVLVGRNATRRSSNARIRQLKELEATYPTPGERLVCLRNNHDKGILNGATYEVVAAADVEDEKIALTLRSTEGGSDIDVQAWTHYFTGDEEKIHWTEKKQAEEFDYGYAMTVHKSQGSQWDNVVLFDESYCFKADRNRWLYTGITRAAEKVTVVRD